MHHDTPPAHPPGAAAGNARYGEHNSQRSLIATLAASQGGHVTRRQLHELGMTRSGIENLIRCGFLIRVHHGVYAVGHLPQSPLARAHGALLAIGDRSALCEDSAGTFWGIYKRWDEPFHVMTPLRRRPSGLIVRRCTTLTRADVHVDPETKVRVTSASRTALDLSARMTEKRRIRMVNDLRLRHRVPVSAFTSVIRRNPDHPGAERLALVVLGSQREPTRSELEDVYLGIVRRFDLPVPEINQHTGGERVDFRYRADGDDERVQRDLIVEVDGYGAHSNPRQFAEDRRRDRDILIATGIPTIRFTYDDCVDTPETVAATVIQAVQARDGAAGDRPH